MYIIEKKQLWETQWREGKRPDGTSVAFGKAGVRLCSGTHSVWATDLLQDSLRRLTHAPSGSAARREGEKRLRIICLSKPLVRLVQETQQQKVGVPCGQIRCIICSSSWWKDSIYGWIYGSNHGTQIRFASQKLGEDRRHWDSVAQHNFSIRVRALYMEKQSVSFNECQKTILEAA